MMPSSGQWRERFSMMENRVLETHPHRAAV